MHANRPQVDQLEALAGHERMDLGEGRILRPARTHCGLELHAHQPVEHVVELDVLIDHLPTDPEMQFHSLRAACFVGRPDIVTALVEAGAPFTIEANYSPPLMLAVETFGPGILTTGLSTQTISSKNLLYSSASQLV